MKDDSAHKSGWAIAEVVFGVPFLIGIALQFIMPFSILRETVRLILVPVGIVFIVVGIGFIVWSRREFSRYGQPTDPGRPTSEIVKTGVFSISRNPMYLGSVVFLFGLALTINTMWILIALLISAIVCQYVLIIPEEKYLAAKFGEVYQEYTATVRRWLGRRNRK